MVWRCGGESLRVHVSMYLIESMVRGDFAWHRNREIHVYYIKSDNVSSM